MQLWMTFVEPLQHKNDISYCGGSKEVENKPNIKDSFKVLLRV